MYLQSATTLIYFGFFSSYCLADEALSPPDIRQPQKSCIISKKESQPLDVHCNATGLPLPTYEWKKGEIGGSTSLGSDVSFDSITGVLSFKSVSQNNEGEYRCYATNRFDGEGGRAFAVSISPPVEIRILRNVAMETEQEEVEAKEYNYIKLICKNSIKERTGQIIHWFDTNHIILNDDRLYIDKYGNLHISYILKKDENIGAITCGILERKDDSHNDFQDQRIVYGKIYRLKIISLNEVPHIAPQLEYSENVLADIFQSALMECVFSGYDPENSMTITWLSSDGSEIQSNKKFIIGNGNRTLEIKKITENDEGKYYCKAKLGSKTSKENEVVLDVTGKPYFMENKSPNDVTVSEGKDVTIPCEARSALNDAPPSPPLWFINGQPLESQTDLIKIVAKTNSLIIKSVKKPDDIKCIACVVSNSLGKIMGEACVNVLLPINVVLKPNLEQEIDPEVGSLLNFTVIATTDISQSLNYKWTHYKDREDYVGGEPKFTFYDRKTRVAYINTTGMLEAEYEAVKGFYKLNISNFYEYITLIVNVKIKGQSPQGLQVIDHWIVYFVIGLLLLIIILSFLYTMFRKQKEEIFKGESELQEEHLYNT